MHPYRMALLIKQRGKDQVANVAQRNSVNQTVEALHRAGYLAVRDKRRESKRPKRTTYEATKEGRKALALWLRQALSTAAQEFPLFPAALATLDPLMSADEFVSLLGTREATLSLRAEGLAKSVPGIPRIFLIESEYMLAMTRAEIKWLKGLRAEVASGEVSFPSAKEMAKIGPAQGGASKNAIKRILLAKQEKLKGRTRLADNSTQRRQRRVHAAKKGPAR